MANDPRTISTPNSPPTDMSLRAIALQANLFHQTRTRARTRTPCERLCVRGCKCFHTVCTVSLCGSFGTLAESKTFFLWGDGEWVRPALSSRLCDREEWGQP